MRNKCTLCGNNQDTQLFHKSYICSNCISNIKNIMKQDFVDAGLIRENSEGILSDHTYSNTVIVSSENQKKK